MRTRQELQDYLENLLGSRNVYYQPPASLQMRYPAIVYKRNPARNRHSENNVYLQEDSYEVTVVGYDPDSETARSLSKLPLCRWDAHYTAENLYHDRFTLFW